MPGITHPHTFLYPGVDQGSSSIPPCAVKGSAGCKQEITLLYFSVKKGSAFILPAEFKGRVGSIQFIDPSYTPH